MRLASIDLPAPGGPRKSILYIIYTSFKSPSNSGPWQHKPSDQVIYGKMIIIRLLLFWQDRHREPTRPLEPLTAAFLPDFKQGITAAHQG